MTRSLALVLFPCFLLVATGHAQVNRTGIARQLNSDAMSAAQSGDWSRAAELFQQSYDLAPRPLTLYNLASAQLEAGALVDADENFRRFLRETAPGQNDQFRTEAVAAREALAGRIAYVTVEVEGLAPGDDVVLDEVTLPAAVVGRSLPVDPGPHTVRVRRGGVDVTMEEFRVGEGQTIRIPLTAPANTMITPEATAAAGLQPSSTTTEPMAPPAEEREEAGGVSPAVWVVGALVIAAGLGVGAYFLFRGEDRAPFESPNAIGDGIIRF